MQFKSHRNILPYQALLVAVNFVLLLLSKTYVHEKHHKHVSLSLLSLECKKYCSTFTISLSIKSSLSHSINILIACKRIYWITASVLFQTWDIYTYILTLPAKWYSQIRIKDTCTWTITTWLESLKIIMKKYMWCENIRVIIFYVKMK